MKKKVIVLDIDYITIDDKPIVRLFAKDGDKNVILIDENFKAYLYAVSDDVDKCMSNITENLDVQVEKIIKNDFIFLGVRHAVRVSHFQIKA